MGCEGLAGTGTSFAWGLGLGLLLVLIGALLLVAVRRRRRARTASLLVMLLVGVTALWGLSGSPPARADVIFCPLSKLVIVQTSINVGMAPGRAPELIVGKITNTAPTDTFVRAVTVNIAAVSKAPNSAPGPCGADDYVLLDTVMPVNERLEAGASTTFSGAHIGFNNKSVNQDACQGATVKLLYRSS